jgi:hypothetical protein
MKKYIKNLVIYIVCLVVCVGLLGGCHGRYKCIPQNKPANIKPIDCKNFNDVTTTYWNLYRDCESLEIKPTCDTLLVEGWGCKMNNNCIYLCPDSASAKKRATIALFWRATGDEDDIDYYYISCTLVRLYDGKPMRYSVELIGDRIYPETENKTGR